MKALFKALLAFFASLFKRPDQKQTRTFKKETSGSFPGYKNNAAIRDAFLLKASGYRFNRGRPRVSTRNKKQQVAYRNPRLTPYKAYILRYLRLKRLGSIDIKPYKDKYGFPAFEVKKSIAQQLSKA